MYLYSAIRECVLRVPPTQMCFVAIFKMASRKKQAREM